MTATANHALQRTATARHTGCSHRLRPQPPFRSRCAAPPQSLSLGSLGVSACSMFAKIKRLFEQKPPAEFRDPVLGLLVSRHSGVWCGDIPFQGGSAELLLPGSRQCPDATRVAQAREAIQELPILVSAAMRFAHERRAELSADRLQFGALNYFCGELPEYFGLDFIEVGDESGNCWQVHFRSGQPIELEYT